MGSFLKEKMIARYRKRKEWTVNLFYYSISQPSLPRYFLSKLAIMEKVLFAPS